MFHDDNESVALQDNLEDCSRCSGQQLMPHAPAPKASLTEKALGTLMDPCLTFCAIVLMLLDFEHSHDL
jgi:hypothetical protein